MKTRVVGLAKWSLAIGLLLLAGSGRAQDSLNVRRLGGIPYWGYTQSVAVVDTLAYVAAGGGGLRIVNISDPANPVEVGFYDTPGFAEGVAVWGSYAYVADGGSGLRVINITNPSLPMEAGYYDTPGAAWGVAVSGSYAYVADRNSGLRVINVTNPSLPAEEGYYDTPGEALGVAVSGNYAYVVDGSNGLRVINIADPSLPVAAGYCVTPGYANSVVVSGNYAYVVDGNGLRVINIANPSSPVEVGYYDTPGYPSYPNNVAVSGSIACLAEQTYFSTYDISFFASADPAELLPFSTGLRIYPNPLNPSGTIQVDLVQRGLISLDVFDVLGRHTTETANGVFEAGRHEFQLNARELPTGIYFVQMQTSGQMVTRKAVVVK
jgi:hypothetical protein